MTKARPIAVPAGKRGLAAAGTPARTREDAHSPRRTSPAAGTTPNAILEAALKIFARDGFDGASMPAIAKAASIGHPLIHYHFGSKVNLWRAAVDYAFGELAASIAGAEQAAAGLEPIDALQLLCRSFAQFTARHPLHIMLLLNEVRVGGERFDWLVERYLRPQHARVDRVIDAAVAAGQIKPIPAAHIASIVVGATTHFFGAAPLVSRLYDVDVRDDSVVEAHTQWVIEVLLRGLAIDPAVPATERRR